MRVIAYPVDNELFPYNFYMGAGAWRWVRVWAYVETLSGTAPTLDVEVRLSPDGTRYKTVASKTFTAAGQADLLWEGTPDAYLSIWRTMGAGTTGYFMWVYITYLPDE
jgi:hypothetical protein